MTSKIICAADRQAMDLNGDLRLMPSHHLEILLAPPSDCCPLNKAFLVSCLKSNRFVVLARASPPMSTQSIHQSKQNSFDGFPGKAPFQPKPNFFQVCVQIPSTERLL
nr:hypothetical protein Iba_chr12dCG18840 [Ipomoea batatas]